MNLWYNRNSMLLTVAGLRNARTGAAVVAGSGVAVTASIRNPDGTLLAGSEITLAATATDGNWDGVFPRTLAPVPGSFIQVIANGGAALYLDATLPIRPRERTA